MLSASRPRCFLGIGCLGCGVVVARYFRDSSRLASMSMPVSDAEEWLGKICRLKVDRARPEPAPHKPLFLLVFFDMLEAGQLSDGMLELTPSLAFRFSVYGSVVAHRRSQKLLVIFPFFHLRSEGF